MENTKSWGITMVRPNTDSALSLRLPHELNHALNLAIVECLPPEEGFARIEQWVADEFPAWGILELVAPHDDFRRKK